MCSRKRGILLRDPSVLEVTELGELLCPISSNKGLCAYALTSIGLHASFFDLIVLSPTRVETIFAWVVCWSTDLVQV